MLNIGSLDIPRETDCIRDVHRKQKSNTNDTHGSNTDYTQGKNTYDTTEKKNKVYKWTATNNCIMVMSKYYIWLFARTSHK